MSDQPNPEGIVVGDAQQQEMSRKMVEDAAEDARIIMAESSIIPKLVYVDIVSRRLFLLVRHALEQELTQGWEVDNLPLIIQTLGMSAQEKAVEEPGTPLSIQQELLGSVIPVIDIFVQMQQDQEAKEKQQDGEAETESGDEVLPGSDPGDEAGVGEVLRDADGAEELHGPGEDRDLRQEEDGGTG